MAWHNGKHPCLLLAVFDGHGGPDVARFVSKRWPDILFNSLDQLSSLRNDHVRTCLRNTVKQVNNEVRQTVSSQDTGSTLCAVLVVDKSKFFSINVGDSRCIVTRTGDFCVARMTEDHKPDTDRESNRIREVGGFVTRVCGIARVQGNLSVSRSLGDFSMHPFVSDEPDIRGPFSLRSCSSIILACDGVFDVLTDKEIAEIIRSNNSRRVGIKLSTADAIRNAAFGVGSTDNISVVVLNL